MKKFCHEGRGVTNSQDKIIDPACKGREFPSRGTISFQNRINVGQNTLDFLPWDKEQALEEIDGETQPTNNKSGDPNRFYRIRNKSRVHQI